MARRFKFQLETVLRVRTLREREAARRVGEKRAEIARVDQHITDCHDAVARCQQQLLTQQNAESIDTPALVGGRAWIVQLRLQIAQHQAHRAQRLRELDELTAVWRAARTQQRILEKLRERRLAEHKHNAARREQADADELAQQLHLRQSDERGDAVAATDEWETGDADARATSTSRFE